MTCPGCTLAETDPCTVIKYLGCQSCDARALAIDPIFFESVEADAITPAYRAVLQKVFGSGWKEGHVMVKAWAEKMG